MPRTICLALALVAALLARTPVMAAPPDQSGEMHAKQVVEGFHATMLDVMKHAKALGIKGRYKRFVPEIAQRFDSQLMIALASGTYWRKAAPAEREKLVAAFRNMSAATYASRFDGYSGQKFEFLSVAPGPRGTMIVRTQIVEPGGKPVPLSYLLKPTANGWRIVDVLAQNGISELAVRRSEYSAILKDGGLPALVRLLDDKTARLLEKK